MTEPDARLESRVVAGVICRILAALERDIWPRLGDFGRDGYDCCGCSSTGRMYDDIYTLVSREGLNALPHTTHDHDAEGQLGDD